MKQTKFESCIATVLGNPKLTYALKSFSYDSNEDFDEQSMQASLNISPSQRERHTRRNLFELKIDAYLPTSLDGKFLTSEKLYLTTTLDVPIVKSHKPYIFVNKRPVQFDEATADIKKYFKLNCK